MGRSKKREYKSMKLHVNREIHGYKFWINYIFQKDYFDLAFKIYLRDNIIGYCSIHELFN
jgi:hypothetical protein